MPRLVASPRHAYSDSISDSDDYDDSDDPGSALEYSGMTANQDAEWDQQVDIDSVRSDRVFS